MEKILFLDLEETIIDSWHSKQLMHFNIEKIKTFAKENQLNQATIFSMALWEEKDEKHFNIFLKDFLEKNLDLELIPLQLELVFQKVLKVNGIQGVVSDFSDIFLFNPKQQMFLDWVKEEENKELILIDDTLETQKIFFKKKNKKVVLLNPLDF